MVNTASADMAVLAKMFLLIGIIILIAGLLYPGADAPWVNFQNTLANIQWPTYNNPFAPQVIFFQLLPMDSFCYINPGAIGGCNGNTTAPVGCTFANAVQCIVSDDEDLSYINISGDTGNAGFQVNGTQATFENYAIQTVNFGVWCRSANITMNLFIHFSTNNIAANFYGTCPVSNGAYVKLNGAFPNQIVSSPFGANYTMFVERNGTQAGGLARITMIDLEINYIAGQVTCTGNVFENTGCQLASLGRTISKFVYAFVNSIVFVGSIIAWVAFLIATFFLAIFQTLVFLYTLPNTPTVVQGVVSAFVTSLLGATIYVLIKLLRGQSG